MNGYHSTFVLRQQDIKDDNSTEDWGASTTQQASCCVGEVFVSVGASVIKTTWFRLLCDFRVLMEPLMVKCYPSIFKYLWLASPCRLHVFRFMFFDYIFLKRITYKTRIRILSMQSTTCPWYKQFLKTTVWLKS